MSTSRIRTRTPARSFYQTSHSNITPPSSTWPASRHMRIPSRSNDLVPGQSRLTYGPGEALDQIGCVETPGGSFGSSEVSVLV